MSENRLKLNYFYNKTTRVISILNLLIIVILLLIGMNNGIYLELGKFKVFSENYFWIWELSIYYMLYVIVIVILCLISFYESFYKNRLGEHVGKLNLFKATWFFFIFIGIPLFVPIFLIFDIYVIIIMSIFPFVLDIMVIKSNKGAMQKKKENVIE